MGCGQSTLDPHNPVKTQKNNPLQHGTLAETPIQKVSSIEEIKNLKDLIHLNISHCLNLKEAGLPLLDFPHLKFLEFNFSKIKDLNGLSKSNLPKLESISLFQVQIDELPVLTLPKLTFFSLNYEKIYSSELSQTNRLKRVLNLGEWLCPSLIQLKFQNTLIDHIPNIYFPALTNLYLSGNQLKKLDLESSKLQKLKNLILKENINLCSIRIPSDCELQLLDASQIFLKNMKQLKNYKIKELKLNSSKVQSVEGVNFERIQSFDASSNLIQQLSPFLSHPFILKKLIIRSNQIKQIPDIPYPYLSELDASDNNLKKYGIKKQNTPYLTHIILSHNQIESIAQIKSAGLKEVNISKNKLKQINFFSKQTPSENSSFSAQGNQISKITYLPNFHSIILDINKLKDLKWILECDHDRWNTLRVSQNQLDDISVFSSNKLNLKNLYDLRLQANKISKFSFLSPLANLYSLNLNQNLIQQINNVQNEIFPALNTMNLNYNKIREFGPKFTIKNLVNFSLRNNQLKTVNGLDVQSLKYLELSGNKLTSLEWFKNVNAPKLQSLELEMNEITKLPNLNNLLHISKIQMKNNSIQDVTQFAKTDFKGSKITYFSFFIKNDLSLEEKKKIRDIVVSKIPGTSCWNYQLQQSTDYWEGVR